MATVIVDYGSGNLRSVAKSFETLSMSPVLVTADAKLVAKAERIVLPGQGAFADCYRGLDSVEGMIDALSEAIVERGKPFLGICVGMQLMATRGLESGYHAGLNWIEGEVKPLSPDDPTLKIPHMGWNELRIHSAHPVLKGFENGDHVYFVHSYYFAAVKEETLIASTDYGGLQTAIVGRDNMFGTQFHPEKSQKAGLRLIENFLNWRP